MFVVWRSNHQSIQKLTALIHIYHFNSDLFWKVLCFSLEKSEEKRGDEKCLCGKGTKWRKATTGERGGGPAESHSSGQPACSSEEDRTPRWAESCHLVQATCLQQSPQPAAKSRNGTHRCLHALKLLLRDENTKPRPIQCGLPCSHTAPQLRCPQPSPPQNGRHLSVPQARHNGGERPRPSGAVSRLTAPSAHPRQPRRRLHLRGAARRAPSLLLSSSRLIYLPKRYPRR